MNHENGRILAIELHPDDVAWTMAGLIAQWAFSHQVDSLMYTDANAQRIGKRRLEEQRAMMDILQMKELYAVGKEHKFKDGHLATKHYKEMVQVLLQIVDNAEAEGNPYKKIVTFGIDGFSGHPDHMIAASVAEFVFAMRPNIDQLWQVGMSPQERDLWLRDYKNYFVHIPLIKPQDYIPIDITPTFDLKVEAIKAHKSQYENNGGIMHVQRLMVLPKQELYVVKNR